MSKPVIFDDGGSIRIRELKDNTTMDGLIGSGGVFASSSSQQFFDGATPNSSDNNACFLLFRSAAESGSLIKSDPVQLTLQSVVTITTTDTQVVTVKFDVTSGKLTITLPTSASAFQHGKRRWYIMRADLIQSVAYTAAVVTATNPASGSLSTAAIPASTMVHFIDQLPALLDTTVKAKKLQK